MQQLLLEMSPLIWNQFQQLQQLHQLRMFLLHFICFILFQRILFFRRIRALRALPLWAKIAMAATIFTVVAGGVAVPVVYFSLQG
jgi:hypothetical protein